MFDLIIKDIKLSKALIVMWMVLTAAFLAVLGRVGDLNEAIWYCLLLVSVCSVTMVFSTLYTADEKSNAGALLTAAGYSRRLQVKARYVLAVGIYMGCLIVQLLSALFMEKLAPAGFKDIEISLCLFLFAAAISFMAVSLYGAQAGGILTAVMILIIMFFALDNVGVERYYPKGMFAWKFSGLNKSVLPAVFLLLSIAFYFVSYRISARKYEKADL